MKNIDISTPGGRLKSVIYSLNLNQQQLADIMKRAKGDISRFVTNSAPLSKTFINELKLKYPELNTEWIKTGVGTSGLPKEIRIRKERLYLSKISDLMSEVQRLENEVKELKTRLNINQ